MITINASPGQQFDPHVSGNLAAYTDNQPISTIRYYDFLTASDQPIPNSLPDGGITLDLLSDVSGSNIVFARQNAGTSRIMVFDVGTATMAEVDPAPAPLRLGAAIGNNTVAYIDFEAGSGDVVTWDLATSTRTVGQRFARVRAEPQRRAQRQRGGVGILPDLAAQLRHLPGDQDRHFVGDLACVDHCRPRR